MLGRMTMVERNARGEASSTSPRRCHCTKASWTMSSASWPTARPVPLGIIAHPIAPSATAVILLRAGLLDSMMVCLCYLRTQSVVIRAGPRL